MRAVGVVRGMEVEDGEMVVVGGVVGVEGGRMVVDVGGVE